MRARQLGADEVVDHTTSLQDAVEPVDLVFDTAGGARLAASPRVLKPGGRLVSVAEEPPPADPGGGIEAIYFVVEPNRDQLVELGAALDGAELRAEIDSVFELEDARAAFERSLATDKRGKVVIRVAPD